MQPIQKSIKYENHLTHKEYNLLKDDLKRQIVKAEGNGGKKINPDELVSMAQARVDFSRKWGV